MRSMDERPACHRAEDLVTYLYGEASEVDARDFTVHLHQCDACRVEFGIFQQVHDSISVWRDETLGAAFSPAAGTATAVDSVQFGQPKRKLSAFETLREFFSVSPLWLRAATASAALLLCVLGVLAISRLGNRPGPQANNGNEPRYTQQQFDLAVQQQVDQRLAQLNLPATPPKVVGGPPDQAKDNGNRVPVNRAPTRTQRTRGLSRQEREQLAVDLGLMTRDDEELPFIFPEEPRQ